MTGKTHMAVGAAAALAITGATGVASTSIALLGGVVGGMLPDTDVVSSAGSKGLRHAWAALAAIVCVLLAVDHFQGSDLLRRLALTFSYRQLAGVAMVMAVCATGRASGHRGFSHSLVALVVVALGVRLVYGPLALPFAAGYASHLAIDLLNKRPLRLLWPLRRGFCLHLCESDRLADSLLLVTSIAAVGGLLLRDGSATLGALAQLV